MLVPSVTRTCDHDHGSIMGDDLSSIVSAGEELGRMSTILFKQFHKPSPLLQHTSTSRSHGSQEMLIAKQLEIETVACYFLSCKECALSAQATDLRGLGLALNTHGSVCSCEPVLVLGGAHDQADSGIDVPRQCPDSPAIARCSEIPSVPKKRIGCATLHTSTDILRNRAVE